MSLDDSLPSPGVASGEPLPVIQNAPSTDTDSNSTAAGSSAKKAAEGANKQLAAWASKFGQQAKRFTEATREAIAAEAKLVAKDFGDLKEGVVEGVKLTAKDAGALREKIARDNPTAEGAIGKMRGLFAPPKRESESESAADASEQSSKPAKTGFGSLAAASAQAAGRMKEAAEATGKKTGQLWQKTAGSLRQGLSAGFRSAQGASSPSSSAPPNEAQQKDHAEEFAGSSEPQQSKAPSQETNKTSAVSSSSLLTECQPLDHVRPTAASSSTSMSEAQSPQTEARSKEQTRQPAASSTLLMEDHSLEQTVVSSSASVIEVEQQQQQQQPQHGAAASAEVTPPASLPKAGGAAIANGDSHHSTDVVDAAIGSSATAQATPNPIHKSSAAEVDLDWLGDMEPSQPTSMSVAPSTKAVVGDNFDLLVGAEPLPTNTPAVPSTKAAVEDDDLDWLDDAMPSPSTDLSNGAGNPKPAVPAPSVGVDADFDDLWDSILDDDSSPKADGVGSSALK
eukprot:TRINITY_DN16090_c0_g1_i1.p1 TRINITY_DN16090_c0_g1~~TRINITY_DN16090_c0_g1_i1.p1  ORF type:complete len:520 (+),score=118.19 TRINITY_DN16090_c0_g1_i1:36-1562(+)